MLKKGLFTTCVSLAAIGILMPSCMPQRDHDFCEVREINAHWDIEDLYECTCVPDHPITLKEAIELALENNLDVRLQYYEAAVQCETFRQDALKELGQLNAFGEVSHRNRNTGSFSQSLTNQPPAPPSISSEQDSKVAHLWFVWNALDFGLAYYQSRQDLDKLEIIKQRQLRARQNLVLDVTRAYYRASVAGRAVHQAERLIGTLKERHEAVGREVSERTVSEMRGLAEQDRIIDLEIKLYAFRNEYRSALTELEALMGIPPSCLVELAGFDLMDVPEIAVELCALEYEALTNRPELIGQDFQVNIDIDEIHKSILNMYPGVGIFGGYNHDSNKFLLFHNWWNIGVHATIDLLSLPSKQATLCKNWYQRWLDERTRLSMSMGVLTQVHLAFINVEETREQYRLAREMFRVKSRKFDLANTMIEAGQLNEDDVIQYDAEALFADLEAFKAFGNLQVAFEQLSNAIGRTLRFSELDVGGALWDVRQPCDPALWMEVETQEPVEPSAFQVEPRPDTTEHQDVPKE